MAFERAFIVGAGTMGHGIAQVCAMAGIKTTLLDIQQGFVDKGLEKVKANLEKGVARGKVTEADKDATLAKLGGAEIPAGGLEGYADLAEGDLFIEAIPERMELKTALFSAAARALPDGAVLGSNTSSLSITEIAAATDCPERVIGLHFFNPVHIMKLLEIVVGAHTSDATLERARAFGERIGKTNVVVNDSPGFATSRLGITLGNEAMRMVEEGVASPADIDQAMRLGYGHPMGPLALSDLVGLDVRMNITEALFAEIGTDVFRTPRIARKLVRAGCYGKKSGAGFYIWEDGKPVRPNPLAWKG
jgi:3-hydroxybutyryl-CoA dehydrogenase